MSIIIPEDNPLFGFVQPYMQYVQSKDDSINSLTQRLQLVNQSIEALQANNVALQQQLQDALSRIKTDRDAKIDRVIQAAMTFMSLGVPYLYGGATYAGMDCSGMVICALKTEGITFSARSSANQAKTVGVEIPIGQEQRGDLLFFDPDQDGTISHEGICIGGGKMIHTAGKPENINIADYSIRYPGKKFVTVRRPQY